MALINKTAGETIARLGEACVGDMMELFGPKDATKEGIGLLTLCINRAKWTGRMDEMLDLGYKLQLEHVVPEMAEAVARAYMESHDPKELSRHCAPEMSSGMCALRLAHCPSRADFAIAAMQGSKMGPTAAIDAVKYGARAPARELRDVESMAEQTMAILRSIAKNPLTDPAAIDAISDPGFEQMVKDLIWNRAEAFGLRKALERALSQALGGNGKSVGKVGVAVCGQSSPEALVGSWAAMCQAEAVAVAARRPSASRGGERRL